MILLFKAVLIILGIGFLSTPELDFDNRSRLHTANGSAIVSRAPLPGPVFAARSDTIDAGHLFVTNLPDSINGFPVYEYYARSLPLQSWLLKKSFFWKTTEQDRGDHALTFLVFLEPKTQDENSHPADSVIVHLHIR